ncbi:hypothetical protein ABBQ32_001452 [Trebouxia sp. C0010 RCD-2024]
MSPVFASALELGALSPTQKHATREKMLVILNKLSERDTSKAAVEELYRLIKGLAEDGLTVLVSCLCATGTEQKTLARKECTRILGVLASPFCPVQAQYLQQPLLGKDPDSSVRETAADALGQIAEHLYKQHNLLLPGETASNPIVCFTKPLAPALWKTLLRLLNSNMFPAKAALIIALARCEADTWQPRGLVQEGLSALQPYLHSIIGQPPSSKSHSSGLVAAISSPDWPTRRAAAEAIKALTVALGPGLDSPGPSGLPAGAVSASLRAAEALGRCRFDKVKPVRDTVQEAQAVLLDLQEFTRSGASDWGSWLAPRLLARGITVASPPRNRPVSPGRGSPTPRPPSALRRAGSHNR